ncbi:MAG: LCP family protein [Actinomycetota bacterium]
MTVWQQPEQQRVQGTAIPVRRGAAGRTWGQRIMLTVAIGTTMALFIGAIGMFWGLRRYQSVNFLTVPPVSNAPEGQPTNWLLVGSDSREGIDPNDPTAGVFVGGGETVSGKRTDTIIVARVDQGQGRIDLMSVPRDLWVPIAGTGRNGRINAAFNGEGGEARLVETVEAFLGIEIHNYAEVNFVGFQNVIDAIGGVPIWFDTPVRDLNSGLDVPVAGCQTLDGYQALAFARSRFFEYQEADGSWRSDPTGDLGRTARQQLLLSRLAATASAKLGPTDVFTIDAIAKAGAQNLILDDGAGMGDLMALARTFAGGGGFVRHSLPVSGFRTSGGASVLALDEAAAQPTLELFRRTVPPPEAKETVTRGSFNVDVRNGARIAGIAGRTAEELTAAGFMVAEVGDASRVDQTTIVYPTASREGAGTLAAVLPVPVLFEANDQLNNVQLIIGPEFPGLSGGQPEAAQPEAAAPVEEAAPAPAPAGENEVGVVPGPGPQGTPCA